MRKITIRNLATTSWICTVLLFIGCSKDEEVHLVFPPSVESKIEAGWADYAASEYESAVSQFESALEQNSDSFDAYNGLGWTCFKLGDFSQAIDFFRFLVPLRETEPALAADAYAGLAAVYMTQNEDVEAILSGWEVLAIAGEEYAFSHDPTITAESIHVLIARCLYNMGEFYLSQVEITAVDPTFPDPSLIPRIPVIETVTAVDSVDIELSYTSSHSTLVLATTAGNVILVASVTDTLGQIDYDVVYANGESGYLFVTGEPLPPVGTQFIVEYAYVEDYFDYLMALAGAIETLTAF